jgi:hypothetical protein
MSPKNILDDAQDIVDQSQKLQDLFEDVERPGKETGQAAEHLSERHLGHRSEATTAAAAAVVVVVVVVVAGAAGLEDRSSAERVVCKKEEEEERAGRQEIFIPEAGGCKLAKSYERRKHDAI